MLKDYVFTSESVNEGHPDKVCDQISDAILDTLLAQDPDSRVACEALIKTGVVVVAGEITSKGSAQFGEIAKDVIRDIGYTTPETGFNCDSCAVVVAVEKQSPDISQGVTAGEGLHKEQGAGDQGMMFGFACDETKEYMPFAIYAAHRIGQQLAESRKSNQLPFLLPDGKCQVSVEYRDGKAVRAKTVVVSTQHRADVPHATLKEAIIEEVVKKVVPPEFLDKETVYFINPTGKFVVGGPQGDCGLTGRKIIVDTYGGYGRHGGGAFSGKDPSKVDRSAAYFARYVAKNIVAAELASRCEVQVAYAIGIADPVSVLVDTFGTGNLPDEKIASIVRELFDFKPASLIKHLGLKKPIYRPTASYGHFGRPAEGDFFTWERTDRVKDLRGAAGIK
ncbi:MAG TPA: methionine adenosyltransferase [Candidatus Binatia bacterium]|jgi:S-adenosylmethionine synthetase|nr:methionine adenosyltransferase [Candidatus Binatia bacterium]